MHDLGAGRSSYSMQGGPVGASQQQELSPSFGESRAEKLGGLNEGLMGPRRLILISYESSYFVRGLMICEEMAVLKKHIS